jgi:hypothetical protein
MPFSTTDARLLSTTAVYRVDKVEFAVLSVLSIAVVKIEVLRVMTPCPLVNRY